MEEITIQARSESWFTDCCTEWTRLLNNSNADQLFMSWKWHSTWWLQMSSMLDGDLCILTATSKSGDLIGIAPLFIAKDQVAGRLSISRVQFVVAPWQSEFGVVSEHLDIIAAKGKAGAVSKAFAEYLVQNVEWDEIALAYVEQTSDFLIELQRLTSQNGWYARLDDEIESYAVDTSQSIEKYVRDLSGSNRRKMFNKRKSLESHGDVSIEYADDDNFSNILSILKDLHKKRWDSSIEEINWRFFESIAEYAARANQLKLSTLKVGGRPISAHFNIRVEKTVYNLFSAIDETFSKKFSPGWIHFGYELESAFDSDIDTFDLLAGPGKTDQYKKGLGDHTNNFLQIQFVRNKPLSLAYRIKDSFRSVRPFAPKPSSSNA